MLKSLHSQLAQVRSASEIQDLYEPLQTAIQLEHSTIPPYLTALYSIKRGSNKEVADIILSVVRQEMLHMTIAANVLNAIGGHPEVNKPDFIPKYPGKLPGNIESELEVGLASLSKELVKNVCLRIEQPEQPQKIPQKYIPPDVAEQKERLNLLLRRQQQYNTIGEFYNAVIDKIRNFEPDPSTGDTKVQVVNEQWFKADVLFVITNKNLAEKALTIIAEQGEGIGKGIIATDSQGELAHYYKFSQIVEGYHLYQTQPFKESPSGFVYNTAQPIPFDTTGIYDLVKNSKAADYKLNSVARRLVDQFNYSYTSLLNGLHKTFNGEPNYLNTVMGLMFDLKLQAEKMAEKTITSDELNEGVSQEGKVGKQLAPSFEYAPSTNKPPRLCMN